VLAASIIALKIEAASNCESLVNFYQTTRQNNPEDSHLHARRRENLEYCLGNDNIAGFQRLVPEIRLGV
jgi:hypothetical protein